MSDQVPTTEEPIVPPASAAIGATEVPSVEVIQTPENPAPGEPQKIEVVPTTVPATDGATQEEVGIALTQAPLVTGETTQPADSLVATQNVATKLRTALALAKGL